MSRQSARHPGAASMLATALAVGVAAAAGVFAFKWTINAAGLLAYGTPGELWTGGLPPLLILITPIVGGLLVGLILHLARLPAEPGHGVTEVVEAVKLDVAEMPYQRIGVKAPVAALSLSSGASLGPEDPAVEIGGSLGAFAALRLGWKHAQVQTLIAAGAAAGISAAFHAPLAAMVFVVEVFGVRPMSRRMGAVAIAALAAYFTMRVAAPELVFRIPEQDGLNGWMLLFGVILGGVAGVLGAGLIRSMYAIQHFVLEWERPPRWLKPAMGGAVVGMVGLFVPEVLGVGYGTIQDVLAGEQNDIALLGALLVAKLFLTAVSFGSGFLGGMFAPTFFAGAMLGAGAGLALSAVAPVDAQILVVVGMAALLAGVVHAPLTSVLLLAAVSEGYLVTPLLLVGALVSYWVSTRLVDGSAYTYAIGHPARIPESERQT